MSRSHTTSRSRMGRVLVAVVAGTALGVGLIAGATATAQAAPLGEEHPEGAFGTELSVIPSCSYTGKGLFGANVREDPRMTANTLGRVMNGEEVQGDCTTETGGAAIGCDGLAPEDQWVKVSFEDQEGWVMSSCLESQGLI